MTRLTIDLLFSSLQLYEYQSVLNNSVNLHHPIKEVARTTKYPLASSDYDGIVSIWDML